MKEVIDEVRSKPQVLGYKDHDQDTKSSTPWIMTFESGHEDTKKKVQEVNKVISNSRTWNGTSAYH